LERCYTLGEFFEKVIYIDSRVKIDGELRKIYLREAIKNIELKKIGFEGNFVSFLSFSDFIFNFFDELFQSKVEIASIKKYDVYAEFDEHLDILEKCYEAYKILLEKEGLYDRCTMDGYKINKIFLGQFDELDIEIDGFLSKFELEILEKIAESIDVKIYIFITKFNLFYYQKIFSNIIFKELDTRYSISLKNKKILTTDKIESIKNIETYIFNNRSTQAEYIFGLIKENIQNCGARSEKICVVLCDEEERIFLEIFDLNRNLNYSMGENYKESRLAKKIFALQTLKNSKESEYRIKKYIPEDIYKRFIDVLSSGEIDTFLEFFGSDFFTKDDNDGYLREILFFFKQAKESFLGISNSELLGLLYERLIENRIDDVGGGKITVSGVLESRGMEYDLAIVLGLNDGTFPKPSQKDIFLNSFIKGNCGIPTQFERESLQKNYLYNLVINSKKTIFCSIENEESIRSSVIDEFPCEIVELGDMKTLSNREINIKKWDRAIEYEIDLNEFKFSFSKLQTYLECKRKFYFRYISKIKEPEEDEMLKASDIGDIAHKILEEAFGEYKLKDAGELKDFFIKKGLELSQNNHQKIEWLGFCEGLDSFFAIESKRQKDGANILELEREFEIDIEGVRFIGKIDRIDKKCGIYEVIDYKTKKNLKIDSVKTYEKSTDFQLEIYYLGAKSIGYNGEIKPYYYDIRGGKLLEEIMLNEKLELLRSYASEIKRGSIFNKTDKKGVCRLCPYENICN